MVTKYFLNLKKIQCDCNADDSAVCSNLGKLQPKLGNWSVGSPNPSDPKVVKSKAIGCPSTGNFSKLDSSSALGVEFKTQGRLHLFDASNQWLYKGKTPISLAKKTNEKCNLDPAADAKGGELNCDMSVYYDVNTVANIFALTQQLIQTIVQLVVAFFRGLFSAIALYVQSLPIALTITVEEFLSLFGRSEIDQSNLDSVEDRSDDSENNSEDSSEPPTDSE